MKWLFCFKYAKTDSFVDKRKAAGGDKTSEHLYPQSSTKTRPLPSYRVLEMYEMYENGSPSKYHKSYNND